MRNPEYLFASVDADEITDELVGMYEEITGLAVHPASPERLFIQWVADVIVQERAITNYIGNQNIPSRAEGQNLDALGELFYNTARPGATAAACTVRFYISEAQSYAVLIPAGTRVTDSSKALYWETEEDAYVSIGNTYADLRVVCQTPGKAGNGYSAGQINSIVDIYDYYSGCESLTETAGGADAATDDEYYNLLRDSMDAYSSAGPRNAYIYFAKRANNSIKDVAVISPSACVVTLYVLTDTGPASQEIKNLVLAACNDEEVRPLTDQVTVDDPEAVSYDITLTYYLQSGGTASASDIQAAVNAAVEEYKAWQGAKLGRDINPSYLYGLLMKTGIKRVVMTSPSYLALDDGSGGNTPEYAVCGTVTVTSGGYEDE